MSDDQHNTVCQNADRIKILEVLQNQHAVEVAEARARADVAYDAVHKSTAEKPSLYEQSRITVTRVEMLEGRHKTIAGIGIALILTTAGVLIRGLYEWIRTK